MSKLEPFLYKYKLCQARTANINSKKETVEQNVGIWPQNN